MTTEVTVQTVPGIGQVEVVRLPVINDVLQVVYPVARARDKVLIFIENLIGIEQAGKVESVDCPHGRMKDIDWSIGGFKTYAIGPLPSLLFNDGGKIEVTLSTPDLLGDPWFIDLAAHFGTSPASPNWKPEYDLNGDDIVTIGDMLIASLGQYNAWAVSVPEVG